MALKFTADGKFLMQIGGRGDARDDSDTARLVRASKIAFDASGDEAYSADGYSNHRVIVFDSTTGEFRRMWGACGGPLADHELINGDTQLSGRFNLVHCIARGGRVGLCLRSGLLSRGGRHMRQRVVVVRSGESLSRRVLARQCDWRCAPFDQFNRWRQKLEEASHRRRSTHRPFSADGNSADRQDFADRLEHSPR